MAEVQVISMSEQGSQNQRQTCKGQIRLFGDRSRPYYAPAICGGCREVTQGGLAGSWLAFKEKDAAASAGRHLQASADQVALVFPTNQS